MEEVRFLSIGRDTEDATADLRVDDLSEAEVEEAEVESDKPTDFSLIPTTFIVVRLNW